MCEKHLGLNPDDFEVFRLIPYEDDKEDGTNKEPCEEVAIRIKNSGCSMKNIEEVLKENEKCKEQLDKLKEAFTLCSKELEKLKCATGMHDSAAAEKEQEDLHEVISAPSPPPIIIPKLNLPAKKTEISSSETKQEETLKMEEEKGSLTETMTDSSEVKASGKADEEMNIEGREGDKVINSNL